MQLLRRHNKILFLLMSILVAAMTYLYLLKGGGIKKDLVCMAFLTACIAMAWINRRKEWLLPGAFFLALILYYRVELGWTILTLILGLWLVPVSVRCDRWYLVKLGILGLLVAGLNFILAQNCMGLLGDIAMIPWRRVVLNLACYMALYLGLFSLTGNWKVSVLSGLTATILLASVNYQVQRFRGSEIKPSDILSLWTAMQVVGNYHLHITWGVVGGWALSGCLAFFIGKRIKVDPPPRGIWIRLAALLAAICCVVLVSRKSMLVSKNSYTDSGSTYNGVLLNFVANTFSLETPEGYDDYDFQKLEDVYLRAETPTLPEEAPNIVIVMNESFGDLRRLGGELRTDVSAYSFYDTLTENTVNGHALASVWGGNTANSEYEVLTGNSMAFLPDGVVAYNQYVDEETFSLPAYLVSLGYETIAMHPENKRNWSRVNVWKDLGFETRLFVEDFPQEKYVRNHISDEEVYAQVLKMLTEDSGGKPRFIFALTMQNHGGYVYEDYPSTVRLEGYSQNYPQTEQYLSLIRESDRALEMLITSLEKLEEDTIVLFFGDHMPKLEEGLYTELIGSDTSLPTRQKNYEVPFFIWANYDIPEGQVELSSLNFLGIDVLEYAGIPLPAYFRFLKDVRQVVPAMNAFGYFSLDRQDYIPWGSPLLGKEEILTDYSILQYNSIRGGVSRSSLFDIPISQE